MSPRFPRQSLLVILGALFLVSLLYFAQRHAEGISYYPATAPRLVTIETHKENYELPVRLKIPGINVDAAIEYVGVTPEGAMEVPSTTTDVGWYKLGPRPGERGSAVIAVHFNDEAGAPAVFTNLDKLKAGDTLLVEYDQGTPLAFVVRTIREYVPGYADEVFNQSDSAHLNLITCGGVWDEATKSYSKRLVVFADIAP